VLERAAFSVRGRKVTVVDTDDEALFALAKPGAQLHSSLGRNKSVTDGLVRGLEHV
jgi:hypothetical protein